MTTTEAPARYVELSHGGIIRVGSLAGRPYILHGYVPDLWTGSSCMACFGACDAARHLFHPIFVKSGRR